MAQAHIASNGFLSLEVEHARITGALELAIRDGELAVGLDRDRDGKVSWGELRAAQSALQSYVAAICTCWAQTEPAPERRLGSGEPASRWRLSLAADSARLRPRFARLRIDYSLLREEDPSHRGLLTLRAHGAVQTAVLGDDAAARAFDLDDPSPLGGDSGIPARRHVAHLERHRSPAVSAVAVIAGRAVAGKRSLAARAQSAPRLR